ncbi:lactate dehydrogenase [Planococcus halocryophilus]|uniref:Lactate dehydrogenase n=2 Tax=Planococcus halocryophilus TaxID=1215089 RepID=A0A1C7DVN1_9BACL|nr:lactate dehydrogenase [Planococcus halocryophilus]
MILGASILQVPAIIKAKEMGLEVIVLDKYASAPGAEIADIFLNISTLDVARVTAAAKEYQIDCIMTLASDLPIRSIAAVSAELKIPGIEKEAAIRVTNKRLMRENLLINDVPIPNFCKISNYLEYEKALEKIKGKVIVKPVDSSGSRGVYLIEDKKNMDIVKFAYDYSSRFSTNNEILVEEYMEGPEVSVESISYKGKTTIIAITDKITTGAPRFVEMGHTQPSKLEENLIKEIRKITISALSSLGIENGPSHTEIIVTEEGPKIVEVGARLGGDNITSHLVPLSTGIDMVKNTIEIALGNEPDLVHTLKKGSSIKYLNAGFGEITNILGIDKVKELKEVKEVFFHKNVGDIVKEITNSVDRTGYIIAQSNSAGEAYNICERASEDIKIITKDIVKQI